MSTSLVSTQPRLIMEASSILAPALPQLALCSACWAPSDALAHNLLLALGDVVQSFRRDGLAGMLLCLCCRATLDRTVLASELLLGRCDLGDGG